jgi:hypothetical protein
VGGATANTRKFLLLLIKAIAAESDEPLSVIANRIHSRMSVSIVKSIAINALTARGRLLPATGSRGSQPQQSQSQPEGSQHRGVAVSARTSSMSVAVTTVAVTAGAVTASAVAAVAVTAERVAGRDKAVRTQQTPTRQQLDSESEGQ